MRTTNGTRLSRPRHAFWAFYPDKTIVHYATTSTAARARVGFNRLLGGFSDNFLARPTGNKVLYMRRISSGFSPTNRFVVFEPVPFSECHEICRPTVWFSGLALFAKRAGRVLWMVCNWIIAPGTNSQVRCNRCWAECFLQCIHDRNEPCHRNTTGPTLLML